MSKIMLNVGSAQSAGESPELRRPSWRGVVASDLGILLILALALVLLHTLTNGNYGFHRDELMTLDNARHLAWGYVEYPPLTVFVGRVELEFFGTSLRGFRFFAAVAQGLILILTGLAARELGGKRRAVLVAALGGGISGPALFNGSFLSYETFDYLCWVAVAYLVIRLLKSDDPRWWVAIGAAIGVGMMTKYTMTFLVAGVVAGVVLTPTRRHLRNPWLWCGAAVAVVVWLPNLTWLIQHQFVTLDFLNSIHARDVRWGRADGFLLDQLWSCTNPVTVPLWVAGLAYLFAGQMGNDSGCWVGCMSSPSWPSSPPRAVATTWRRLTPYCSRQAPFGASGG